MDILAHTLWAGLGMAALRRRRPVSTPQLAAAVLLAAAPDVVQLLPPLAWTLAGAGRWATLWAYALATPGQEPALPAWVALASHHLHCTLHSAVIAAGITLLLWSLRGGFWLPLLGWWSHIVIDVFTHSAEFYPAPVLYPFTQRGFDGWAWNSPVQLALNYAALAATAAWLAATRPAAG